MKTYSRILVGKYLLPDAISDSASSLISGLLQVHPIVAPVNTTTLNPTLTRLIASQPDLHPGPS